MPNRNPTVEGISLKKLHKGEGVSNKHLPTVSNCYCFLTSPFSQEQLWSNCLPHKQTTTQTTPGSTTDHSHINDIFTSSCHLGFPNFQVFSILKLNTENGEKQQIAVEIYETVGSIVKLSVLIFSHFLSKIVTFLVES